MPVVRRALLLLALVGLLALPAVSASSTTAPIVEYAFDGSFADLRGNSTVTVHPDCPADPCNTAAGTGFGSDAAGSHWAWSTSNARGGGFTLDLDRDLGHTYSVGVRFRFAEVGPSWRKVIDYKNRVDDTGFYLYDGQVQFYPEDEAGPTYSANEVLDLIAVREGSAGTDDGTFLVYAIGADGTVSKTLEVPTDADSIPVVVDGGSRLGFFHDDTSTSSEATTAGRVYSVKVWDRALSAAELEGALDDPATADLSLTKTASPTSAEIGDLVTYTLDVRNSGPDPATGTTIVDTLPDGVVFSSATAGCDHDGGKVTCDLGALAAGGREVVRVVVAVTAAGTLENTATVTSLAADPDQGDATDTAMITTTTRQSPTERVAGSTRIETAIIGSRTTFEDEAAKAVVLARADTFPDALAGGALAVAKDGPLLLNPTDALLDEVLAEIDRVLPHGGPVHLLGGPAALAPAVEDALERAGYAVERLAGADRYETAIEIAEALDPEVLFLATGLNYPDALAAGAAAAEVGGALLLTADRDMHPASAVFVAARSSLPRYAAGGQAAAADPGATALAGEDRYGTALLVAEEFFPDPVAVGLATGTGFADALSGVAHIGRRHGPMLLSDPVRLTPSVRDHLRANAATIEAVFLYGGPAALSPEVEEAALDALR